MYIEKASSFILSKISMVSFRYIADYLCLYYWVMYHFNGSDAECDDG